MARIFLVGSSGSSSETIGQTRLL